MRNHNKRYYSKSQQIILKTKQKMHLKCCLLFLHFSTFRTKGKHCSKLTKSISFSKKWMGVRSELQVCRHKFLDPLPLLEVTSLMGVSVFSKDIDCKIPLKCYDITLYNRKGSTLAKKEIQSFLNTFKISDILGLSGSQFYLITLQEG